MPSKSKTLSTVKHGKSAVNTPIQILWLYYKLHWLLWAALQQWS